MRWTWRCSDAGLPKAQKLTQLGGFEKAREKAVPVQNPGLKRPGGKVDGRMGNKTAREREA